MLFYFYYPSYIYNSYTFFCITRYPFCFEVPKTTSIRPMKGEVDALSDYNKQVTPCMPQSGPYKKLSCTAPLQILVRWSHLAMTVVVESRFDRIYCVVYHHVWLACCWSEWYLFPKRQRIVDLIDFQPGFAAVVCVESDGFSLRRLTHLRLTQCLSIFCWSTNLCRGTCSFQTMMFIVCLTFLI